MSLSPDLFDVDAAAGDYRPVVIRFRGAEYVLGATAAHLLALSNLASKLDGKGTEALAENLRPVFAALAPEAPTDLTAAEEIALLAPLTEVLNRLGRITFRAA
jgi:hypothetical protein